ncbi:hypothetical protein LOZ53_005305 [Ophidiomyces ophidiicola]|uniref:Uncharacterized protein n=1 Tax=Ophidiomyces ophidiicola TaxID=1387563 RepID=A0ACB8UND9_9EURO|nr:uncharacterized protein LOZ57_004474 [Ophidiomyces ophidiicola]KAI1906119.1 hypothetical protein LOZ64_006427 [Ophidiomyces ophidiicola]KAI1932529.1 hypothetical protein LOZ62_006621 [Ophidiomyces ophidiicola]KAI1945176.1 hypothetical protein LOZ57_004474 [Ophidiomyces ophidiicola]KAI1963044.1 hypothetical protein LOZ56_006508 [Ophidiomyces ophidiicola]KAI1981848.1 hypothetical protein LOZ55_000343 [Ophidiomyces ophidiicola]
MSKDSSPTYVHFHHPRLADLFEDFNRPYTSAAANSSTTNSSFMTNTPNTSHNQAISQPQAPSFLPIEDIFVLPQYQPVNPEDEDDVVPDQHAAFGITRAMDGRRELVWRDLGLEDLMRGVRLGPDGGEAPGARGKSAAEADLVGSRARRMRKIICLR